MEKKMSLFGINFVFFSVIFALFTIIVAFIAFGCFTTKNLFFPIFQERESTLLYLVYLVGLLLNIFFYLMVKKNKKATEIFLVVMFYLSLAVILIGSLSIFGVKGGDFILFSGWSAFWGVLYLFLNVIFIFLSIGEKSGREE